MKKNALGNTGLNVSQLTLGTMTFGTLTEQDESFEQMDMALESGINAFDTAELYSVLPISRETQGRSERIIGQYMKERGNRDKIVVMSKVAGAGNHSTRDGEPIDKNIITRAIDRSLQNLQTDCIDLYQLHWPNRGSYHFRKLWGFDVSTESTSSIEHNLLETLETLEDSRKAGKIRAYGTSNETSWGAMKMQELSRTHNLLPMASIQNEYSLLHRIYEPDLSEIGQRENIGLLTYSSLACGILTGKYGKAGETTPDASRRSMEANLGGRLLSPTVWDATQAYLDIAQKHGIDPVHFAYRFCISKPFVTSVIIGATRSAQLAHILKDDYQPLSSEILAEIDDVRRLFPIPI